MPGTQSRGRRRTGRVLGSVLLIEGGGRLGAQVAVLLVARILQPRQFGLYTLSVTLASYLLLATDWGSSDAAVQQLTADPVGVQVFRRERKGVRLLVAAAASVLAGAGLAALWLAGRPSAVAAYLLVVVGQTILMNAVVEHRIAERFSAAALPNVALVVSAGGGALAAALLWHTALAAAIGAVLATTVVAAGWRGAGMVAAIPRSFGSAVQVFRDGSPFFVAAASVSLYTRGDRLFVAGYAGDRTLGLYSAAFTLVFALSLGGAALQVVGYPRYLRQFRAEGRLQGWGRDVLLTSLLSLAPTAMLYLWRRPLVVGLYGSRYEAAAHYLGILVWIVPFYFVNPLVGNLLVASGRQRVLARVAVVNLVVAVGGYWLFTAEFGATGAAAMSVAVEGCGCCQLLRAVGRQPAGDAASPQRSATWRRISSLTRGQAKRSDSADT